MTRFDNPFDGIEDSAPPPQAQPTTYEPTPPPLPQPEPQVTHAAPVTEIPVTQQQSAPEGYYAEQQPEERADSFIPDEVTENLDKAANTLDEAGKEISRFRSRLEGLAVSAGMNPNSGSFKLALAGVMLAFCIWLGISFERQGLVDFVPWPEQPGVLQIDDISTTTTPTTTAPVLSTPTTIDLGSLTPSSTTPTTIVETTTTTTTTTQPPATLPETSEGASAIVELFTRG